MNNSYKPVIGITMGDPVGIGPEIICRALDDPELFRVFRPLVIGDVNILKKAAVTVNSPIEFIGIDAIEKGRWQHGQIDVLDVSHLDEKSVKWASPTQRTGHAMIDYINVATDMAMAGTIDAITTCPINKAAMKLARSEFHGHTEMIAHRTNTPVYAMMMAGDRLKVVLATIHMALKDVPGALSTEIIETVISLTEDSLKTRFGIVHPKIAVAALNPHAGEEEMFGSEESTIIRPAVSNARAKGIRVTGPLPPDTLFYQAVSGAYDAVVCMYHDQGLIPFKMIHFTDGVNTTLGLPVIRTSVDHGTAYDIAGQGKADPGSLVAALKMAAHQALCVRNGKTGA